MPLTAQQYSACTVVRGDLIPIGHISEVEVRGHRCYDHDGTYVYNESQLNCSNLTITRETIK